MNKLKTILTAFCFLLSAFCFTYAQKFTDVTNQYIQNPSFEDYTTCPQSNSAYPSSMWIDSVVGWYAPTQGTSDYFNACNTNNLNSVPNNTAAGFQYAFDGVGYCGFLAYDLWSGQMWSEYIQTKLKQPLKANTTYQFSMRINRGEGRNFSAQNVGANFSNVDMKNLGFSPYNLTPTILNTTGFLTDTLGWTLVSGQFTATGNENYLTIGWFGDTISSDFIFFIPPDIDTTNGDSLYAFDLYYLVDSLTLSEQTFDVENFNINVITPNADGSNDFLDFSVYDLQELSFTVFNRWGNRVFSSNDIALKWDGKNNNGKQLSDGTYFYILNATTSTGKQINKHNYMNLFY